MKDIKERVRDKNPKIRNPAARLPKELVRSAVLEAKEKPRELHEKSSGQSESPTQYGTEKIESVQYRAASVAGKSIGKTTYQGGKKLAGVTYRKIKERKSRQEEAKAAPAMIPTIRINTRRNALPPAAIHFPIFSRATTPF